MDNFVHICIECAKLVDKIRYQCISSYWECYKSMDIRYLHRDSPDYPVSLYKILGEKAPIRIAVRGNPEILQNKMLALFCSVKCPGRLILKTYDLVQELRHIGLTVIGGFHSPMERKCLTILLRCAQPIIICLARSIEKIKSHWRMAECCWFHHLWTNRVALASGQRFIAIGW